MSQLPSGWATASLGDLCHRIVDGSHNPPREAEIGKPMLSAKNIWDRKIHFDSFRVIADSNFALEDRRTSVRPGDVLLTIVGAIGRAAVVPLNTTPFTLQRSVAVLKPNSSIDSRYLAYAMESPEVQQFFLENAKGTAQKGVYLKTLASLPLPVAPLAEQRRIADKLERLLAAIDTCKARLDAIPDILNRFRQSVLAVATSGELTEDWRTAHGLQLAWKRVRLDEIAEIQGGITKDSKKQLATDREVPYLRVANVQRGHLDLSEIRTIRVPREKLSNLLLEVGDVLFTEGGDIDKLGRGWIWEGQIESCTYQNHIFRARLFEKRNQPKYVSLWANYRGLSYFLGSGKQTTNLASINKSQLSALPISLPTPDEQAEIVQRVELLLVFADRASAICRAVRNRVDVLAAAILSRAFRGELVSQDSGDEPATILAREVRPTQESRLRKRPQLRSAGKTEAASVKKMSDVLNEANDWLPAQEIFRLCGVIDGSGTEEIEALYAELRELDRAKRLRVQRVTDSLGQKVYDRLKLIREV
jgi:type I restriction enzyme, S subunit